MKSPDYAISETESLHILLSFCTFCTLLKGKKISIQNVFLLILQDKKLRNILKELLVVDSNMEIIKMFLDFEPSLATSKYITKFLNTKHGRPILDA
jgi:hypothetical protein